VVYNEAMLAYSSGDVEGMRRHGEEALSLARQLDDEVLIAMVLFIPAMLAYLEGDFQKSGYLFREALAIHERRGGDSSAWIDRTCLADIALTVGDTATAMRELRHNLEFSHVLGDNPVELAYIAENVGIGAIQSGQEASGLSLLAAAQAARERLVYRETPDEASRRGQWIETARRRLGPEEADVAWERGLRLTLDQAIGEARTAATEQPAPRASAFLPLTRREAEVALLVAQGLTNGRIASRLHLSERTVENHVQNALNRLDLNSRAQLAVWMARRQN
jgi:non-specific serine/threonine protein kinase